MKVWIFGYASLMWRPGFAFVHSKPARIAGLSRRLEQGSPDHRGTHELPGRVATLVPDEAGEVHGIAFALPSGEEEAILAALDEREQEGYERRALWAEVETEDGGMAELEVITWIASPGNRWHLGPAPLEVMLEGVLAARGPSGTNVEYVLRLHETLSVLGVEDAHVTALAEAIREALARHSART